MSVSAAVSIGVTVTETLTSAEMPLTDSSDATIKAALKSVKTLNSGSTPDAEMHSDGEFAMTAGAVTIDLTALTRRGGSSVSFSGKAPRAVVFKAPSTNANDVTLTEGASNGHPLLGAAWKIILKPGQLFAADLGADGVAVGSSDRTIDVTGTGTQKVQMLMVAG